MSLNTRANPTLSICRKFCSKTEGCPRDGSTCTVLIRQREVQEPRAKERARVIWADCCWVSILHQTRDPRCRHRAVLLAKSPSRATSSFGSTSMNGSVASWPRRDPTVGWSSPRAQTKQSLSPSPGRNRPNHTSSKSGKSTSSEAISRLISTRFPTSSSTSFAMRALHQRRELGTSE